MHPVLFIDQTAQLGGAELSLLALVRARRAEAADRVVLFEDGRLAAILSAEGFDVAVSPFVGGAGQVTRESGLAAQLATLRGTHRQVRKVRQLGEGFAAVYANTAKSLVVAALAVRRTRTPLIYHLRDILTASHFSRTNRCVLVHLANRYAARVIANSQATAAAFVAAGGHRHLVAVVPNGFDPAPFDAARAAHASERLATPRQPAADATSPRPAVVAVFGRFAPWKGQDVAIRAAAELPEVELWLVGDALFGEQDYALTLRQLARDLGVEQRVRFLGFRDDVPELMQRAAIVAHTSRAPEPFGRVVVEAMLSRRPLVATRGGGVEEIVEDGATGLLATMGDPADLRRCLRRLLDDPAFAARLAAQAAETARERYSLAHTVAQVNQVIDDVVQSRPAGKQSGEAPAA